MFMGWSLALVGLAAAISSLGLVLLLLCPWPVIAGACLARSRARIVQAVVIMACWLAGLGFVLA
jgi:hypothetical protein